MQFCDWKQNPVLQFHIITQASTFYHFLSEYEPVRPNTETYKTQRKIEKIQLITEQRPSGNAKVTYSSSSSSCKKPCSSSSCCCRICRLLSSREASPSNLSNLTWVLVRETKWWLGSWVLEDPWREERENDEGKRMGAVELQLEGEQ